MAWAVPAVVAGLLVGGYTCALVARPHTLPGWNGWRVVAWVAGVALVAVAVSPPLAALAHHDHRSHMAQHLLLGMYAPLGLVLGAPLTLVLGSLPRGARRVLTGVLRSTPVHLVSHPLVAAGLSVGGMFVLYLTPLYELSMVRQDVHRLVLAHFLIAGYLYTWAIAGPDPAPRRPGTITRVTVLVVAAGAHAVLSKMLYADARELGGHGATSMESAAQWMYYGGDVAELLLAVMLFAQWYRRGAPAPARQLVHPSPRDGSAVARPGVARRRPARTTKAPDLLSRTRTFGAYTAWDLNPEPTD